MMIAQFLAMTSAEFDAAPSLPEKVAWMACHFSPYGIGLSNLPTRLPEGSLLILNDRTPMAGQEPDRILHQLRQCIDRFRCSGVLLDWQRTQDPRLKELTALLQKELPCPVAAPPEMGAADPVFIPPIPPDRNPEEYLSHWDGRTIWLETALDGTELLLTEQSAVYTSRHSAVDLPLADEALCCHYRIRQEQDGVRFTLGRTEADLEALLNRAAKCGVVQAVGLYQELNHVSKA